MVYVVADYRATIFIYYTNFRAGGNASNTNNIGYYIYHSVSSRLFFILMRDCWITKEGKIIEVGSMNHNSYASDILKQEFGRDYYDKTHGLGKSPYRILHERGWIRVKYHIGYLPKIEILGDCIDLTKQMRNTIDPAMNSRQMRVAKMLCDEVGEDFNRAINNKRFW